jgi:hypothetical protein
LSLKGIFVLMKFRKKCTVQDAPTKDGLWQVSTPAFILVVALGSAILYHFPLYKFAVNNLDISSQEEFGPYSRCSCWSFCERCGPECFVRIVPVAVEAGGDVDGGHQFNRSVFHRGVWGRAG